MPEYDDNWIQKIMANKWQRVNWNGYYTDDNDNDNDMLRASLPSVTPKSGKHSQRRRGPGVVNRHDFAIIMIVVIQPVILLLCNGCITTAYSFSLPFYRGVYYRHHHCDKFKSYQPSTASSSRRTNSLDITTRARIYNKQRQRQSQSQHALFSYSNDDGDEDYYFQNEEDGEEDMSINWSEQEDWRDVRARLVMNERFGQQQSEEQSQQQQGQQLDTCSTSPSSVPISSQSPTSSWAYQVLSSSASIMIEPGMVLLGRPRPNFGYGMRQQYFHKAVVLILEHDDEDLTGGTLGILLNRPSKLSMSLFYGQNDGSFDYKDSSLQQDSDIWYGGEVQSMHAPVKDKTYYTCLHFLSIPEIKQRSTEIIKGIHRISLEDAQEMVQHGIASASDFWVFAGYCGWSAGQLQHELNEQQGWISIATDSQTLQNIKQRQQQQQQQQYPAAVIEEAGVSTWRHLMDMIVESSGSNYQNGNSNDIDVDDLQQYVEKNGDPFDDLILKEWARRTLIAPFIGARRDDHNNDISDFSTSASISDDIDEGGLFFMDELQRATAAAAATAAGLVNDPMATVRPGSLFRASSQPHSPFLLSNQDMHKCLVLVTSDNMYGTVGVFLNHPTTKLISLMASSSSSPEEEQQQEEEESSSVVQRYGGSHVVYGEGEQPLLFLHCNEHLRRAGVGFPLLDEEEGIVDNNGNIYCRRRPVEEPAIWECTMEQVNEALRSSGHRNNPEGAAIITPRDFMVISGGFIWEKIQKGEAGGMRGELWCGRYEPVIPSSVDENNKNNIQEIWDLLLTQEPQSEETIDQNLAIGHAAWQYAGAGGGSTQQALDSSGSSSSGRSKNHMDEGNRKRSIEHIDPLVFDSNVNVSTLADAALRRWVAMYILNKPRLSSEL